jgi:hypothetical protein
MLRWTLLIALVLTFAPLAPSQSAREDKLNKQQAKTLNDYAEDAMKAGFPRVAKRMWLMLLSEYDPEHADARKALGYQKVGDSWAVVPGFVFPKDDVPDQKKADQLKEKWVKVSKTLADAHLAEARDGAKAGRVDMARKHYEKVIFYTPDNEEAQAELQHKPVAGLTGTDLEQVIFERSKKIEKIVADEARKEYPVEVQPDTDKHPYLEAARVPYQTVRSEHFTVRGDFDVELLKQAAQYGERAIRVMQVVTEGFDGFSTDPKNWVREWAFFQDSETYKQILTANAELMTPEDLKFRIEHTGGCTLGNTVQNALEISAKANEQSVNDGAVRNVARSHSNFRSAGLLEGIGHTIVGMMFNNNRAFLVDRQEQLRSSTGEEDLDKFSPNMDTWKDLALESAWKLTGAIPAALLPLIDAAKFTDDARIKSWSFCDYVVRRDPSLLLALDACADQKVPINVDKKFTEENDGLSVAQLEKEWKDFWTEATPVLKAIRNNTEPLSAVSKDVKTWLKAFNDARKTYRATEVTWSSDYSGRCREHAEYLFNNVEERGPAREHTQNLALPGGTHLGAMFAEMAIVEVNAGEKPKDIFKRWMAWPGYRDCLLNYRLRTIGLYSQENILVLDVIRGLGQPPEGKGGLEIYPSGTKEAVPVSVDVADLGPEVAALLAKHGHADKTVLGYPITLHQFGNGGLTGNRDTYRCKVTIQGEEVPGIVHMADGGSNRRSSAPGMVVFYPLEPLRRGMEVDAVWTFEREEGTTRTATKFNT